MALSRAGLTTPPVLPVADRVEGGPLEGGRVEGLKERSSILGVCRSVARRCSAAAVAGISDPVHYVYNKL